MYLQVMLPIRRHLLLALALLFVQLAVPYKLITVAGTKYGHTSESTQKSRIEPMPIACCARKILITA
jgi:hypothetical protein